MTDTAYPPIENYGFIGDCESAALVGSDGSIDWLCWPHFSSDACFAALVGTSANGRWLIAPEAPARTTRRYVDDTLVLETLFDTDAGTVAITDFMPIDDGERSLLRRVEGRSGRVEMRMHLVLRFEYGVATPWVTRMADGSGLEAIAGQNRIVLRTKVKLRGEDAATVAEFEVGEGETIEFAMTWNASHLEAPGAVDFGKAFERTKRFWEDWSSRCVYKGEYRTSVLRSLLTLKALQFAPTGALVAAPTTSLPEQFGGSRNWDYRYCWLRDATLTLLALMAGGYRDEASAWHAWLDRAVAGNPEEIQIMYGLWGERRLLEWEADWLNGYRGSRPVHIGNAASDQRQLDVFGEVMGTLRVGRLHDFKEPRHGWDMQVAFIAHLSSIWDQPDDGIWEMRGERRHFVHSKIMAWVAVDSSIKDAEDFGLEAPLNEWRHLREKMHQEICEKGFDAKRNTFTQSYGSAALDAVLLLIPQTGFLAAGDERMIGTVKAIESELLVNDFVLRYRTDGGDGLPAGEAAFLPCTFWLAQVYYAQGRGEEAKALFERLLSLRNDLGLLAEEYDAKQRCQAGNFPQAFSHLAIVGTALALEGGGLMTGASMRRRCDQ